MYLVMQITLIKREPTAITHHIKELNEVEMALTHLLFGYHKIWATLIVKSSRVVSSLFFEIYDKFIRPWQLNLLYRIQIMNDGTDLYQSLIQVIVTSGRDLLLLSSAFFNFRLPKNVTVRLFDNYYGRRFDSLNDKIVHRLSRFFFQSFTDVRCVSVASF